MADAECGRKRVGRSYGSDVCVVIIMNIMIISVVVIIIMNIVMTMVGNDRHRHQPNHVRHNPLWICTPKVLDIPSAFFSHPIPPIYRMLCVYRQANVFLAKRMSFEINFVFTGEGYANPHLSFLTGWQICAPINQSYSRVLE